MSAAWTFEVADEGALGHRAAGLAAVLAAQPPAALVDAVVALSGDLGVGKTAFVRALLRALGHEGPVRSPTYTLVEPYPTWPRIVHADLYRLGSPDELAPLGLPEQLGTGAVAMIEWPERAGAALPTPDLSIRIDIPAAVDEGRRRLAVTAGSARAGAWLAAWRATP